MSYKIAEIGDVVPFWFAANLTTGAAGDGATPLYDVRLAGAASDAAPTASGTPTLLSHANYTDGLHEILVDTAGYSAGEYAVFCTLTISGVNPAGFVGSFRLLAAGVGPISAAARVMTAVPNAAAGGNGGLPTVDASNLVAGVQAATNITSDGAALAVHTDHKVLLAGTTHTSAVIPTVTSISGYGTLVADVAAAVWAALTAGMTTAGSIGKKLADWTIGTAQTGDAYGVVASGVHGNAALKTLVDALPTAAENASAAWDEAISGHLDSGSTGAALNAAGSAGDPWSTELPGAYGSGTAGKLIGDNVNATISSRAAAASALTAQQVWEYATRTLSSYGTLVADIWAALTSGLTTAGSIGKKLADWTIGTAQTGDAFARLGAPAGASIAADVAAVKVDTAAILADTGTDGVVVGSHAAAAKAEINAEVVDALATDTYAEPSSVPAATSSLADKLAWLFALGRNKLTQTSAAQTLRNDADGANIATAAVSDDATTFTRDKWSSS